MPTDRGRGARGPGPVPQRPTGMGMPGLRDAALASARATGIFRRRQASIMHAVSGGLDASQVAECSDGGQPPDTARTEGVPRVHDRAAPPSGARLVAVCRRWRRSVCAVTAQNSLGRRGAGRGRTDNPRSQRRGAGPQVARPAYRISCRSRKAVRRNVAVLRAWSGSSRARRRARRASSWTAGTSTSEGPCAHQARQWAGITTLRLPRAPVCCGSGAGATTQQPWPFWGREPRAKRRRGRVQRQRRAAGAWTAGAGGAWRYHTAGSRPSRKRGLPRHIFGDRGDRDGLCMDIHPYGECARLRNGDLRACWLMVCHQVALTLGSSPAFATGGNLPPSEVIMSRPQSIRTPLI